MKLDRGLWAMVIVSVIATALWVVFIVSCLSWEGRW